jgi:DNA-directed RNA polymerase specialized sigma24 family protein
LYTARRRNWARERPIPADTVLYLDPAKRAGETPSVAANRNEEEAWVRLGLELLDPEKRDLVVLRQWDQLSFAEIGEKLAITENAARLRYLRALNDLSNTITALRRGDVAAALTTAGVEAGP